jgi:pilus assembly protein CpaF
MSKLYDELVFKTLSELSDIPSSETLKKNIEPSNTHFFDRALEELEGLGPLRSLLDDTTISEIIINGYDTIFFERSGRLTKSELTFTSEKTLLRTINRLQIMIERVADVRHPVADGTLKDGSRVHLTLPPVSIKPIITIRKHIARSWLMSDLMSKQMLTLDQSQLLQNLVQKRKNILICGATNTGKTTLLRTLLGTLDPEKHERIITIEDTFELDLKGPNCVSLVTREDPSGLMPQITLQQLLKNSLRMRPDRIIVGEIRDGEALTLLDAMATGHSGTMCSMHAQNPQGALMRLEGLVSRAAPNWSIETIKKLIAQTIQIIVLLKNENGKRQIAQVAEVSGFESFGYLIKILS